MSWIIGVIFVFIAYAFYHFRVYRYIGKDKRHRALQEDYTGFPQLYNEKTRPRKKQLFDYLTNSQSNVEPKNEGLRILEVGIGPGCNFEFYPSKCRLIAVEPNKYFIAQMKNGLKKFPGITLEKTVNATAEDLRQIKTGSVDVVVTTLVCCSVQDVHKAYREIKRVLVPGGKYLYLEHVLDRKLSWLHIWQRFLSVIHFWQFRYDGCRIDQNFDDEIRRSKCFSNVEQERFSLPVTAEDHWALHYVIPHVLGCATK